MESIWQSFRDKILQLDVIVTTSNRKKRQSQPPPNADKRCCTTSELRQSLQFMTANQIQGDIDHIQPGDVENDDRSSNVEIMQPSTTESVQLSAIETNIIHHDQTTSLNSPPVSVRKACCIKLCSYSNMLILSGIAQRLQACNLYLNSFSVTFKQPKILCAISYNSIFLA